MAPGIIETETFQDMPTEEKAGVAAYSTFDRLGQPADVADIVAFAASDDAHWVTGQCIDATGGSALGVRRPQAPPELPCPEGVGGWEKPQRAAPRSGPDRHRVSGFP